MHYCKKTLLFLILFTFFLTNCGGKFGDARNNPTNAQERARKSVEEGRAAGLGTILGRDGSTNYEFNLL